MVSVGLVEGQHQQTRPNRRAEYLSCREMVALLLHTHPQPTEAIVAFACLYEDDAVAPQITSYFFTNATSLSTFVVFEVFETLGQPAI